MNSSALLRGFGLGLSLIVAIGPQNAFVLKQGLKKSNAVLVAGICALSDIVLIAAGLGGMGVLVGAIPELVQFAGMAGIAFLLFYGLRSLRDVFQDRSLTIKEQNAASRWLETGGKALAFTWLNPHVYLDTVVLIGSLGLQFDGTDRLLFGLGAGFASIVWFFSLALGAAVLSPYFANQSTWRVLNLSIAGIMFWTAYWMAGVLFQ